MIDANLMIVVETQFIPMLVDRIARSGYTGFTAHSEPIGNGVNVIIGHSGRWVQEFTIQRRDDGSLFYTRVIRTS